MFIITWIIRAVYYIIDLFFASALQTLYDRFTGNIPPPERGHTQHQQIRITPPTPLIVYIVGLFLVVVVLDRFSVFAGYYSEREADERWASEMMENMCTDDKRYRGRIYEENCRRAYKIRTSGRAASAFQKTLGDTHLCIWWDCSTLTYNTLTSMPSLTAVGVVLLVSIFICGAGPGGGMPQTILIPSPPPIATTPKPSNS